jgi:hypothetical protein
MTSCVTNQGKEGLLMHIAQLRNYWKSWFVSQLLHREDLTHAIIQFCSSCMYYKTILHWAHGISFAAEFGLNDQRACEFIIQVLNARNWRTLIKPVVFVIK